MSTECTKKYKWRYYHNLYLFCQNFNEDQWINIIEKVNRIFWNHQYKLNSDTVHRIQIDESLSVSKYCHDIILNVMQNCSIRAQVVNDVIRFGV